MIKLVDVVDPKVAARNKDAAEYLRELADRWEAGEVLDMVVVLNDKTGKCYGSYGNFDDRWRLLAALEYAKAGVFNS